MAWFGDGLSSLSNLKGQITNFTKEVLSEGIVEEIDERSRQFDETNEKCIQLQGLINAKDAEIALLRRQNCELQKAVVELNARPPELQDDGEDDGGGFFWDPPSIKNHEFKSDNNVRELEEQLSQATVKARELEMELEKYRKAVDKKEEIVDGHQKAELMRTKQDMVNLIIQIGEKGREAEKNMKKLQFDELAFVNDFRAAISKLDSSEQIYLVRCALTALEVDNGAGELRDNNEKLDIGRKKNFITQYNNGDETTNVNGVYNKEAELRNKIQKLEEENKSLSVSIDELDQQHAQSIEKILTLKEELQKKHRCLQTAYESLYVDYNSLQEKNKILENDLAIKNYTKSIDNNEEIINLKLIYEDKNIQTELLTISNEFVNNTDKEIQTEDNNKIDDNILLNEYTEKINEIVKNLSVPREKDETIFEAIAKQYVEDEWKIEMLERQLTELSCELRDTNELKDSLQMEFDDQQSTIESLEMEIQHLKSSLPSIPEASEERVAVLEIETESMAQEIKRLQSEYDAQCNKNLELITSMSNMEGSLRNQENLEAEVRNTKQQLEIAQQQLAGASKNVENNENMMEDLSRRLHTSLDENNELRKKIDNLESCDKQMHEELKIYIEKCKGLDENLELIEELKLDINNVRIELKNSVEHTKQLEKELAIADDAKKEVERDILSLSQEKEQLEMELKILQKCGSVDEDSEILEDLRNQLEVANREKDDLEYDLLNMRKELDLALNESSNREIQCNNLIQQHEKLINENNSILEQMNSTTNEWQERLELLQTEMNSLQQEHTFLREEATADKTELVEIRSKVEYLEDKSIDLDEALNNSKSQYQLLKNDYEILQSRANMVTELEEEVQRMQSMENNFIASQNECKELNIKLINLQDENEKLIAIRDKFINYEEQLKNSKDLEEKLKDTENRCQQLENQLSTLMIEHKNLMSDKTINEEENNEISGVSEEKSIELELLMEEKNQLTEKLIASERELQLSKDNSKESADMAKQTIETLSEIIKQKDQEIESIKSTMALDFEKKIIENETASASLKAERDELVKLVQVKHTESVQYHAEIQRMTQLFNEQVSTLQTANAERESYENLIKQKDADILWAQNELQVVRQRLKNFEDSINHGETCNIVEHSLKISQVAVLNEKCNAMEAALIKEQSNNRILQNQLTESQQRESAAAKELERLRTHLVEIEGNYTEEALLIEQSKKELEGKLLQAEETLKNSSTVYTSANIRANQQVETLQQQMTLIIQQRDEIQNKLSIAEDKVLRHTASLMNLQIVLEQFQRDKENDIRNATEKIREQLKDSYKKQEELNVEITSLKGQLAEAKECLQAASRLSEQLNKKSERIQELNNEVCKLTELVDTAEQRIQEAKQSGEGKVDKSLMKNLLLGFLASSAGDKSSVLRVLATVLDFNEVERDKAGLNHVTAHGGWFSGLLSGGTPTKDQEASLSAAFVRFLESESKPMPPIPPLPISNTPITRPGHSRQHSSSSTQSGLLLSNMSLPSFPDFIPSRNTGSILKEVLKDS